MSLVRRRVEMLREEALKLIDDHRSKLSDPAEVLPWMFLRLVLENLMPSCWGKQKRKLKSI